MDICKTNPPESMRPVLIRLCVICSLGRKRNPLNQPLLQTVGLKKYYKVKAGRINAVDNINLSIQESQTLGVVGESGCGKTTLGRTILRLVPATSGQILFRGENILEYSGKQMHECAGICKLFSGSIFQYQSPNDCL
jgi:ABC-type glutathione transport system ATPase component